jgi:aminopeptidase N
MADANQTSLDQFERWYSQSGTPVVSVTDSFDPDTHTYTLTLEQTCPPTPGQTEKQPFHIPFAIGLITPMGHNLQLFRDPDSGEPCSTTVLNFTEAKQSWSFSRITDKPVLSLLRNFSAPVKLNYAYTDEQLAFLMRYDENDFCRWEAGQELAIRTIMNVCDQLKQGEDAEVSELLIDGFETILNDTSNDKAFRTLALTLPSETELLEKMLPEETDLIFKARETVRLALAERLEEGFFSKYQSNLESASRYSHDHESVGRRSLKNLCLGYLVALEQEMYIDLCVKQFERANNMTDQLSALAMLSHTDHHARDACLSLFYNQWQKDPLVVDKWLAIQAQARRRDTLSCVRSLMQHPAFTLRNPNRVRALIGSFAQANPSLFHHKTGEGYQFLTDQIIELDRINPQIAARMVVPLIDWKKFDRRRQVLMREQLQRLYDSQSLSPNTFELVSKALIKTQC